MGFTEDKDGMRTINIFAGLIGVIIVMTLVAKKTTLFGINTPAVAVFLFSAISGVLSMFVRIKNIWPVFGIVLGVIFCMLF